jgi:carbon monoxide dehydrogenase subunit G
MATISKQITLAATPEKVWDALRDFAALHTKLARGFVSDTKLEAGGTVRIVTFANGAVMREHLVSIDDAAQRLVYAITDSPRFSHYNASAQVFADGSGAKFVWIVDFLPDEMAPLQQAAMDAGSAAIAKTLGASHANS